jgi:hypothetical protein
MGGRYANLLEALKSYGVGYVMAISGVQDIILRTEGIMYQSNSHIAISICF